MARSSAGADTRWWYGIALPIGSIVLAWGAWATLHLVSVRQPGTPPFLAPAGTTGTGSFLASIAATVLFVVLTALSVPVFSLSLFMDSREIRRADDDWAPSPILYGGISLLHLPSLFVPPIQLFTLPAGAWYLYRRWKTVGLG